jgi:death on curing protein
MWSGRSQPPLSFSAAPGTLPAQDQPFVDGNKRTGLAAALVFLDLNDVTLSDPEGHLYQAMVDVAERRLDKHGLADLLRSLACVADS